jgi:GNAT superfamily N-acetyltransferase
MRLRRMTSEEFGDWLPELAADYGAEQAAVGLYRPAEATGKVLAELERALPDGVDTADHVFLVAEDDHGFLGRLWLGLVHPRGVPDQAWINDIEVAEHRRGEGLGRELLTAAEAEIRSRGIGSVGLNVFGPNAVARRLYESAGYEVVTQQMRKRL